MALEIEKISVYEKYNSAEIGTVKLMSYEQILAKIEAAKNAYTESKNCSNDIKSTFLKNIAEQITIHRKNLSSLICHEAGKPLFYAENEVDRCIKTTLAGIEALHELDERNLSLNLSGTPHNSAKTKRFPIGIVFGIAPFNFPLNLALHKIIPAICSGNALIIKPSPLAPLSLQYFFTNIIESLSPIQNWLTIIHCSDENSEKIATHEDVKMISFTGSASVGWHLKEISGRKKIALELGGNAAIIVDNDIDLKSVAEKCCFGSYLYSGQICISTQRIYVHEEIFEYFLQEMIEAVQKITSGDPTQNVVNGPIISNIHLRRIQKWVSEAVQQGAKIIYGGEIISEEHKIYAPTLLTKTTSEMLVVKEEIFGPVSIIESFTNFDEAIKKVNESKYGLQTGLFTNNLDNKKIAFKSIESGAVIINNIPGFRVDEMPYGGIKESGFGREGIKYAIEESTELKLYIE
jgi:acyl-CoA reductase-like NAD-dependent aldehyde dehydrogenase